MSADLSRFARRAAQAVLAASLVSCTWFTDFKEQPKIDPWDAKPDSTASRGNPQGSVSIYGSQAPEFAYSRDFNSLPKLALLVNPVPADSASVNRGRQYYQINCAVCHGPSGMGDGKVLQYVVPHTFAPPALGPGSLADKSLTDGYIFGIIRNGRGLMPSYNRIEEPNRWDIVNYIRSLEGKGTIAADTSHGRPGETGDKLPGATQMGPTRPAPYYHMIGAQAGAREGLGGTSPAPATPTKPDTAKKPPTSEFKP